MNKSIVNTVKIAGAAIAAILIADACGITFAVSAGIVAILTIQPTKRETVKTAFGRLAAFVAALIIAYVCFTILGYGLEGFFVYLVIFILFCQLFKWYSAMAMNSVLISHFITLGNMSPKSLVNEAAIFAIGVTIGILVNMTLREDADYLKELKEDMDEQIKHILTRMSERISDRYLEKYDGECFVKLSSSIAKAKSVALENYNNKLGSSDSYDRKYIEMREKQYHVMYEMYKLVRDIETTPVTAEAVSSFFLHIAENYREDNSTIELLDEFHELADSMKSKPLPANRAEFDDRAKLFTLLRYIEEFLKIKVDFSSILFDEK